MDVAFSTAANHTDRNELDPLPCCEEGHQRFRFNLETLRFERQGRPSFQMNEPEAALRIGQMPSRALRKFAAHPPVHPPAQPGNFPRLMHAVADHEQSPGSFGAPKQRRQILRRVLAIAVQGHRPFKALFQRQRQTGPERGAFAKISLVTNRHRAALPAWFEVSSVEPSSTTNTAGRCWRTTVTRGAMVAPLLKQGTTATLVIAANISRAWAGCLRKSRLNSARRKQNAGRFSVARRWRGIILRLRI